MLRDESFHPLEFDHHLFFNKDSKNPLPSDWITANAHPIIERVGFRCNSFSSCLSCLSCLSMFPNAANRINGTWSLLATGHKDPLFHPRMIRPVVGGGGPAYLRANTRDDCCRRLRGSGDRVAGFHGLTPTAKCCRRFAAPLELRAFARGLSSLKILSTCLVVVLGGAA